ncbi:MAG: class II aldolase/adducin family protein [Alphaproteobacteria bacterium]
MATVVRIDQRTDPVWQARVDLAAAHRLANRFQFDDGIWNHFTVMVPGTKDRFFVKAHGTLMSEVTASNLIVCDFEGNVVEGQGEIEATAYCIHSQFHKLHPHGAAVLHCHPYYAAWLCMTDPGRLMMVHQDVMAFDGLVAYDDSFEGQGQTIEEAQRMAKVTGDKPLLLSANHGLTSVADSVAEAWYDLYYFEKACKTMHSVIASGAKLRPVPEQIVQFTRSQQTEGGRRAESAHLNYAAMKRTLDRDQPDYKT